MLKALKTKASSIITSLQQQPTAISQKLNVYPCINRSSNYLNYTTTLVKKNIVEHVFAKQYNSSNGNIRYYSTLKLSPEVPSNSIILQLDPVKYNLWTKEQVCSLLCAGENDGGAGLSIEDVKPLYDAGFDGTSLDHIVNHLQSKDIDYAYQKICSNRDYLHISQTALENIVNWADNLLKTRLFHFWSDEQFGKNLIELVGLSENEGNKYMSTYSFELSANEMNSKIGSFLRNLQLTPKDYTYSLKQIVVEDTNTILKRTTNFIVKNGFLENHLATETKLYTASLGLTDLMNVNEKMLSDPSQFLTQLKSLCKKVDCNITLTDFKEKLGQFTKSNLPVTFMGLLNKQHLPFINSLQYEIEGFHLNRQKPLTCFSIIAPSGMGKTALMNRLLTNNLGLFFTCSDPNEICQMEVTDEITLTMKRHLNTYTDSDIFRARQSVYLLLITKLVYLLHILDCLQQDPAILDENVFGKGEKGFMNFLSFCQFNRNTSGSVNVLNYLLKNKCILMGKEQLVSFSSYLLSAYITTMKNLFPNSSGRFDQFFVCIDEANLFAKKEVSSEGEYKYKNLLGQPRSYLVVLAEELALFAKLHSKDDTPFNLLFAGTNFSIDIFQLLQSAFRKTDASVVDLLPIYSLDLLSEQEFFDFMALHIELDDQHRTLLSKFNTFLPIFPMRRRTATTCIEGLINGYTRFDYFKDLTDPIISADLLKALQLIGVSSVDEIEKNVYAKNKFVYSLLSALDTGSNYLRTSIQKQFATLDTNSKGFLKDVLIKYITHFIHGEYLGRTFEVRITNDIVNRFVTSGLMSPKEFKEGSPTVLYEACDAISFLQAKYFLNKWFGSESLEDLMLSISQ